ncbi:hypothetical protein [Schaalia sp. lx-260]|uniref:hypothetical protein n=1 Tax=Schaalia sp. lx-260 TaxID=2899082 RepID=UPI001E31DAD8|nr:hypothetical protein [Schaalia sp. lx-260]MCD4550274.1 hypothetical protein [Schaalia sp. lx-260]
MNLFTHSTVFRRGLSSVAVGTDHHNQFIFTHLEEREIAWLTRGNLPHTPRIRGDNQYVNSSFVLENDMSQNKGRTPSFSHIPTPVSAHRFTWVLQARSLAERKHSRTKLRLLILGVDSTILLAVKLASELRDIHVEIRDDGKVDPELDAFFGGGYFQMPRGRSACQFLRSTHTATAGRMTRWDGVIVLNNRAADPMKCDEARQLSLPYCVLIHDEAHSSITPVMNPQKSPCPQCIELYRNERDPFRAHMQQRLRDIPVPQLSLLRRHMCAISLAHTLRDWGLPTASYATGSDTAIPIAERSHTLLQIMDDGSIRNERIRSHPRCSCVAGGSSRSSQYQ